MIHASAQPLWHGAPLPGDRQMAGWPHSTQGAGGPMRACRQSRTTRPGRGLVALDMPRRSFAFREAGVGCGWPGRGMALPQARHWRLRTR